jgi:HK97 gp10 family phage protein
MSNEITVKVEGFDALRAKIKQLGDDKSKRKEVNKILGQIANPTLDRARALSPIGSGTIKLRGGRSYKRKKRYAGRRVLQSPYQAGTGKKSIAKKIMTRAKVPMVTISPRSRKSADGFYLRQFVIPGTKQNPKKNDFLDKAYNQTKNQVSAKAERRMVKYFNKQINRLSG